MARINSKRESAGRRAFAVLAVVLGGALGLAAAQVVEPPYDADYELVDLGPVPGLPSPNGGLTFSPGDPWTLLIGGLANDVSGAIYSVSVERDANLRITGFSAPATFYTEAAYHDGGVAYGPDDVLFLSRYPYNEIGQNRMGSPVTEKVSDLTPLGVTPSPGGLNFVPDGFPGAGQMKVATWDAGGWYSLQLQPDGTGTFEIVSATLAASIPGGPEGFVYVPPGSPLFPDPDGLLVSEWSDGNIAAYRIDAEGNPIPSTRTVFVSGLEGPEGAAVDPLTGDFLFSTFTNGDEHLFAIRGFTAPEEPSEPGTCESFSPEGHGYWHRQCLGVPEEAGGLAPGGHGKGKGNANGPSHPTEPGFADALMPCADATLAALGFGGTNTCEGIQTHPPNDPCERATRLLTSWALNLCSERVQAECAARSHACGNGTLGELLEHAAAMISAGQCREASVCLTGIASDDPPGRAGRRNDLLESAPRPDAKADGRTALRPRTD